MVLGIFLVFFAIGMGLAAATYALGGLVVLLSGLVAIAVALTGLGAALLLYAVQARFAAPADALPA